MRLDEFYEPEDDVYNKASRTDKRTPTFTLMQLNKLRKYRDLRKIEDAEHLEFVKVMYAPPQTDDGTGGGPLNY